MKSQMTIGFLLGAVTALTFAMILQVTSQQPVYAANGSSGGQSDWVVVNTGNFDNDNHDMLWVIGKGAAWEKNKEVFDVPHLVVYEVDGNNLRILAARNIKYDFKLDQFPPRASFQDPTVKDVYDMYNRRKREARKAEEEAKRKKGKKK